MVSFLRGILLVVILLCSTGVWAETWTDGKGKFSDTKFPGAKRVANDNNPNVVSSEITPFDYSLPPLPDAPDCTYNDLTSFKISIRKIDNDLSFFCHGRSVDCEDELRKSLKKYYASTLKLCKDRLNNKQYKEFLVY